MRPWTTPLFAIAALAATLPACRLPGTRPAPTVRIDYGAPAGTTPAMDAARPVAQRRLASRGLDADLRIEEGDRLVVLLRRGAPREVDALLAPVGRLDFVPAARGLPFAEALSRVALTNGFAVADPLAPGMVSVVGDGAPPADALPRFAALLAAASGGSDRWFPALERTFKGGYAIRVLDRSDALTRVAPNRAEATQDEHGNFRVRFELSSSAAAAFGALTDRIQGHELAIVYDGRAISVPVVRDRIDGGSVEITLGHGGTLAEARTIAAVLSSGELPHPLVKLSESRLPGSPD